MTKISLPRFHVDARPGNGARGLKRSKRYTLPVIARDARPGNGARGLKLSCCRVCRYGLKMRAPATGRED